MSNDMTACKQERRKLIMLLKKNGKLSVKTSDGWNIPQSTVWLEFPDLDFWQLILVNRYKGVRDVESRLHWKEGRVEFLKENFREVGGGISERLNLTAAIWFMTDGFQFRKSLIFPEIYFCYFSPWLLLTFNDLRLRILRHHTFLW